MENYVNNISFDAINEEYNRASNRSEKKQVSNFDEKNYLNVRLRKDENKKELQIRILPISATEQNPFVHVFLHNVEVPKEMVKEGKPFKSYICLNPRNNPDIDHKTFGDKCPFCEMNEKAYKSSLEAKTPVEKKALVDLSLSNRAKEAIIVRCIERGKEDEGVKFWKFNLRFDESDPYHKILNLHKKRNEESIKATGKPLNILDLMEGRDLTISVTRGNTENQTTIDIYDSSFSTPLSSDPKQAQEWINDSKTWQDVFTTKPYDYLQLILEGKIPWRDRESGKWIDKAIVDAQREENLNAAENDIEAAETSLNTQTAKPAESNTVATAPQDDLPF